MPDAAPKPVTLSPSERYDAIFQTWKELDSGDLARDATVLAVVVLLIAGGLALRRWWLALKRFLGAFDPMARELKLGWPDRWFLIRVARQQQLPNPLTLLLSPATLEHHGRAYAESLIPARRAAATARVETIKTRIFGQPTAAAHRPV